MKLVVSAVAGAALLGLAACANNTTRPTDTGNMALPAPQPQGNIGTARPLGRDTGSMGVPAAAGGTLQSAPTSPDTGNMALPRRTQTNSRPTGSY